MRKTPGLDRFTTSVRYGECRGAWYTWTDMYMYIFRQLRVAPEGISDRLIVVG